MDHEMLARVFYFQARMLAIQTEIESMKVANAVRQRNTVAMAYHEEAFQIKANELYDIASDLHTIGW